jgi:hypothetical protein
MKLLFITTQQPDKQGDFLEVSILHGLREYLGDDCVDYPKKKIMYHDFSESPKEQLHGRGFTLLTTPIQDISNRNIFDMKFDAVLYGDGHIYGENPYREEFDKLSDGNVWIIDGHDLYGNAPKMGYYNGEEIILNQYKKSFKRELVFDEDEVYPTGFGIPKERILPIDFNKKNQLVQKTAPSDSIFNAVNDVGGGFSHHKFSVEEDYYEDLSKSWFGLTCKKGGWDCLRHYEIIASGALLLFKDYNLKPPLCSPQNLPCFSYSTLDELNKLMDRLVVDGNPTSTYVDMLNRQRMWLYDCGTTVSRAKYILTVLNESFKKIGETK